MIKKITTVNVLNPIKENDPGITQFIKDTFGENTIITMIRSSKYSGTPYGPANLVSQHKKKKNVLVCVNKNGIEDGAIENAALTGNSFAVVYEDGNGKWNGFRIGEKASLPNNNLVASGTSKA